MPYDTDWKDFKDIPVDFAPRPRWRRPVYVLGATLLLAFGLSQCSDNKTAPKEPQPSQPELCQTIGSTVVRLEGQGLSQLLDIADPGGHCDRTQIINGMQADNSILLGTVGQSANFGKEVVVQQLYDPKSSS